MRGYIVHHRSGLYGEVRADLYHNDPYVWFSPYLWSFCHLNQRPKIEEGMTVLWLSKVDGAYACDLVFVVDKIMPLSDAVARYAPQDQQLAADHFSVGIQSHADYAASNHARTYVADMDRSYIPHPAVAIECEVDAIRQRENQTAKGLAIAWSRPSVPLRIGAIAELERFVFQRAKKRLKVLPPVVPDGRDVNCLPVSEINSRPSSRSSRHTYTPAQRLPSSEIGTRRGDFILGGDG